MTMENQKSSDGLAPMHIFYIGDLLINGIKDFHKDLLSCKCAPEVLALATYVRMIQLGEKFEQAMILSA